MRAGRATGPRAQPQPQRGRSATYAPCTAPLPPPFFSVRTAPARLPRDRGGSLVLGERHLIANADLAARIQRALRAPGTTAAPTRRRALEPRE